MDATAFLALFQTPPAPPADRLIDALLNQGGSVALAGYILYRMERRLTELERRLDAMTRRYFADERPERDGTIDTSSGGRRR
jgi:hypothetical protein